LIKTLKPDELLLLISLDSSGLFLSGVKALKNSIGIPSGPPALKLGVEEIASLISSSSYILVNLSFMRPWIF